MARFFAILMLPLILSACSDVPDVTKSAPADEVEFTRHFIDLVQRGDFKAVASKFDFYLDPNSESRLFQKWSRTFSDRPVRSKIVTHWARLYPFADFLSPDPRGPAEPQSTITLRYTYDDGDAVDTFLVLKKSVGVLRIAAIELTPFSHALLEANRIDRPKPLVQTAFALLTVANYCFVVLTFVLCLFGTVPRWRVRWLLLSFILVECGRLIVNWTTGQFYFQLWAIESPFFGTLRHDPYKPLFLSMGLPVAAIFYWTMRRSWLNDHAHRLGSQKLGAASDQSMALG